MASAAADQVIISTVDSGVTAELSCCRGLGGAQLWEHTFVEETLRDKSQLLGLREVPLVWAGGSRHRGERRVPARAEVGPAEPRT